MALKQYGFEKDSVNLKPEQGSLLYKILYKYGQRMVDSLGKSLDRNKDASGALRESIRFNIKILGDSYIFQLKLKDYYKWVDEGRKPGKMPPEEEIIKWVRTKFINKASRKSGRPVTIKNVKSTAYAIRRKIAEKGIKPTRFYSKVINKKLISEMKRDIGKQFKKDVLITLI